MSKSGATIQTLQVGMSIIDFIARKRRPLKFAEIQEETKITKSNLYKYLNTFIQLGMLYRDKETGAYVLGSKFIEYGMIAVDQENVLDRITPFLQEINLHSQCTVLYSVWTHNGPMVVKIFNDSQGLNIGAQIGTILPVYSAIGKVFLTFLDDETVSYWLEKQLQDYPSEKLRLLENEKENIRETKISFASEPLVPSVSSVAFPILNYNSNLLGAVTVVGFSENIPKDVNDPLSEYLLEMSTKISETFGYKQSHND